jgi:hypothetical protein
MSLPSRAEQRTKNEVQLESESNLKPSLPYAANRAEYTPKEADPQLPPLTGVRSREGLQLPLPRRSLGVEFVHRGQADRYFVLIGRMTASPCSAKQV